MPFSIQLSCDGIEYIMLTINKINNVQCKTEIASYRTIPPKELTFVEVVPANTIVTFVGLVYSHTFPFPAAILQFNNKNYLVNPLGLVKLYKVDYFEELEDVYGHTQVLYKGFTTKSFVDKKGVQRTITTLVFDKI